MPTPKELVLLIAACLSLGFIFGYIFRIVASMARKNSIELEIKKLRIKAEEKHQTIVLQAEEKAAKILESAREQIQDLEGDLRIQTDKVNQREIALIEREKELESEISYAKQKVAEVKDFKDSVQEKEQKLNRELEKIASLTQDEARKLIIETIERDEADALASRLHKLEHSSEEKLEAKAKEILTSTIQRLAVKVNADLLTTHLQVSDPETKGKIIGKEGRNIRVFERETGTEVLVDESPNSITISAFDPIRRFIAKRSMELLIEDGRIQPAKIEKVVSDVKAETDILIKKQGEKAVREVGIPDIDPRIVQILGRLYFRTSYGQNVLNHSIETSHLAGMLAEELGANVRVSKTAALLHDLGKALDHEVQGTHVEIGRQILQKFGMDEAVIKAMQAHHEEYPYETLESRIVQTADAISGGRPGARENSLEFYIKRLSDLENIALSTPQVEKAFAVQAGREIRVFVNALSTTDLEAKNIAKKIASRIEQELKYPGEIKVAVIRETRIIETAR